ncbi:hypothetical protein PRZ48_010832 [Zasmidium cellare]|uniref:Uncharacterized protein n=1 Tax=Zasmidium cellare TaxID=395010 RepID=A0ABR0EAA6_ZASCE|nr:hypothetical protein PRZ48_010832 [Zasmidium cellare]
MNNDTRPARPSPYQSLPHGHIRVLCLLAGPPDSPLKAHLKTRPLYAGEPIDKDGQDDEAFEAISYCWGTAMSQGCLHLTNGSSLSLTQSLYSALQAFRRGDKPRNLWVDAVCINQEDVIERSSQVQMMGRIYAEARRVLVWLGPCFPGGSEAVAFVTLTAPIVARGDRPRRELLKILEDHLETATHCKCCKTAISPPQRIRLENALAAVAKLFERPWFERLWVVQEVALAKEVLVHCGTHFVSWEIFTEVLRAPGQFEGDQERKVPNTMPRQELRQVWAHCNYLNQLRARNRHLLNDKDSFKPTSLCKDLLMLSRLACQDPHDRIYGVSRVLGLHTFDALRVDYSITVSELYRRVVELSLTATVNKRGGRAVLMLALAGTEVSEASTLARPSWVPHLQYLSERSRSKHAYYQWAMADREFFADAADFRCRVSQHDPELLLVRGTFYGRIHMVLDGSACPSKHVHRRIASKCPDHEGVALIKWYVKCCHFLETDLLSWQAPGQSSNERARRMFGASHAMIKPSQRRFVPPDLLSNWLAQASVETLDKGQLDDFVQGLGSYITGYPYDRERNLCLLSTDSGFYAAWVPPLAKPGDHVCYFAATPYPFIVRSSGADYFQLIGDALILGLEENDMLGVDSRDWSVILDRAREADSNLKSWMTSARRSELKSTGAAAELQTEDQLRKSEVEIAISQRIDAMGLKTDVLIVGAGPIGLLATYILAREGIQTITIDKEDKTAPDYPMTGSACCLYPRTLEFLDQLDLYDGLAQTGFVSRGTVTYDKSGTRISTGISTLLHGIKDGYFDHTLHIRQKYCEDAFRNAAAKHGARVTTPATLHQLAVNEETLDEYKVSAAYLDATGQNVEVQAKYVIACDGGKSTARKLAGIPFQGESSVHHLVRMDAVVETDMPEPRLGFAFIHSPSHGHILWTAIDRGATRIGYGLNAGLFQKYGVEMSAEDAMYEAKQAVLPFKLEFKQLDWFTVYGIQQRIAETFHDASERIYLAGDAAHTHSSAAAQGMNTGVHDATNLCWRLAGVLKGTLHPRVLSTYSEERRKVAQELIAIDKDISVLVSGHKPDHLASSPKSHSELLQDILKGVYAFNSGLPINYGPSFINDKGNSLAVGLEIGHRVPDTLLQKPGLRLPVRLLSLLKANGKFKCLVFTSDPARSSSLEPIRRIKSEDRLQATEVMDLFTIVPGVGFQFDETLGFEKFGNAYWDIEWNAHLKFGIGIAQGACLVVRPDGILSFTAALSGQGFENVRRYFSGLTA